jgi:hypothetical protein
MTFEMNKEAVVQYCMNYKACSSERVTTKRLTSPLKSVDVARAQERPRQSFTGTSLCSS